MREYSDHDGDIDIEEVEVDGKRVTVITIHEPIIVQWYEEGLERAVIHIEDEPNSKFF